MHLFRFTILLAVIVLASCTSPPDAAQEAGALEQENLQAAAQRLAQEILIVDGHVDVPYRLQSEAEDVSQRTESGDFDYPRAKEGGLDAPFMSIFTPSDLQEEEGASKALADELIDMVEALAADHPEKFALANSVADVRSNFSQGLISLPLGMENGAPIGNDLGNLAHFYERGVRYVTLAHAKNNLICDAAYDEERRWNGLSPFGREVVAEMNRLGMMIDISHLTDETIEQILEQSQAPVIASHSSCRKFTPGWERNMGDEQIRLLGEKGGVMMINFGSSFLNEERRREFDASWDAVRTYLDEHDLERGDPEAKTFIAEYRESHPSRYAELDEVLDHIDHVVDIAGIDHVGFGSDFDGVGDSLPEGLKDVSGYPNLIAGLLARGYSEEDIEKICSGNLLRVWSQVEAKAEELQRPALVEPN